ncbi:MAG: hypothetical protein JNL67_14295 [Planctomycetaceae bacterium]|nr:hypothetical protein [Planctomycetaceae bacterium]
MSQSEQPQGKGHLSELESSSFSAGHPDDSLRRSDVETGVFFRPFVALGDIFELARADIVTEVSKEHPMSICQLSRELLRGIQNWEQHFESRGFDYSEFREHLDVIVEEVREILKDAAQLMPPDNEKQVFTSAALHEKLLGIVEAGISRIKSFVD